MAKSSIKKARKWSMFLWWRLPEYATGNRLPRTQFLSYKDVSYIFEKDIQSPFQNGVTHLCSSKFDQMPADFLRRTSDTSDGMSGCQSMPRKIVWHLVNFWATEMCHTILERRLNFLFKNAWNIPLAKKLSSRQLIFWWAHLKRKGGKTLCGTFNAAWRGTQTE